MKRKLTAILSAVLCVAVVFAGCGKSGTKKADDNDKKNEQAEIDETENMKKMLAEDENLVAVVGNVGVTQADYNFVYKLGYDQMWQYSQSYGEGWYNAEVDDGTTIGKYMKDSAMNSIVELIAVSELAEENGIKVDEKEVDEQIQAWKEQLGGDGKYNEFLNEHRTTDEAVRTYFERDILLAKLLDGDIGYEDIVSEFEDTYMRVQHILISTQEGRSDSEALAIANEVIAKLDGGADFDGLIDEYDEDPGMTSGNYYTFTDGQMVAEFETESKNLKVGEYSKTPVKTDYGYHIIKKYEVVTACQEFDLFKNETTKFILSEMIVEKADSLKVEKKDDVIDENIEDWMKDLGVDTSAMPSTEGIR